MPGVLAILGNLAPLELLLVGVLAVLVFGRRLPEVAVQAARILQRARDAFGEMRREAGIDDELRDIRHSVARTASLDPLASDPAEGEVPPIEADLASSQDDTD